MDAARKVELVMESNRMADALAMAGMAQRHPHALARLEARARVGARGVRSLAADFDRLELIDRAEREARDG